MGTLPVLQKIQKQQACPMDSNLPTNYMSDYSVLGLVVDRLDRALQLLKENKFEVQEKGDGFKLAIDGVSRMSDLFTVLNQSDIEYALTDIVDQIYQG
ncbi:MAG: hypothetical protein PVI13_11790 [Desulfobacterales bacterium]|jgi:hypothetical protein